VLAISYRSRAGLGDSSGKLGLGAEMSNFVCHKIRRERRDDKSVVLWIKWRVITLREYSNNIRKLTTGNDDYTPYD